MKAAILFCVLAWVQAQVLATVWEFGSETPGSVVVSHFTGKINILKKVKTVYLTVPPCYEVTYVRVEVDNMFTTPEVNFNRHVNAVTISYKLLQFSQSAYDIIAKAKYNYSCYPGSQSGNEAPNGLVLSPLQYRRQSYYPGIGMIPKKQNYQLGC